MPAVHPMGEEGYIEDENYIHPQLQRFPALLKPKPHKLTDPSNGFANAHRNKSKCQKLVVR